MDIRVSGKNLSVTEGMREHLREKLLKLEKYAPRLVESHAVLVKEKYLYEAEITLLAKHLRAYGEGRSKENIYTAIDMAYGRIEKQLKRYRERVKDHYKGLNDKGLNGGGAEGKRRIAAAKAAEEPVLVEKKPSIVRSRSFAVKPMSPEEASLQLEISPEPFLAFLNAATKKVNVIFKRQDGNHGLVEPGF